VTAGKDVGMAFVHSQSALIAAVPAVELVVGGWRERDDSAATRGVPAHVTLLYPFVERGAWVALYLYSFLAELALACAIPHRAFSVMPSEVAVRLHPRSTSVIKSNAFREPVPCVLNVFNLSTVR
jgi:hypothetical protein